MVNFTIQNTKASMTMRAATIKTICSDVATVDPNQNKEDFLTDLACPKWTGKVSIGLLIGVDYLGEIYGSPETRSTTSGFIIVGIKFDNCLMGSTWTKKSSPAAPKEVAMPIITVLTGKTSTGTDSENQWSLESIGIHD